MSKSGIDIIQRRAIGNELDYSFIMDCLKEYASPRTKLTQLLKSGDLIRIKKGLYLLGNRYKKHFYSYELLANIIYGPSYVSLEKALQIYGLIPEHVEIITSVTPKKSKEFKTPVAYFSYTHCTPQSYPLGITTYQTENKNIHILMATPEKALYDILTLRRGKVKSVKEIREILTEDLRIDEEELHKLNKDKISEFLKIAPHSAIFFLEKWLRKLS